MDGSVLAELSLVPAFYAKRNLTLLRGSRPLSANARIDALAAAGQRFLGTVDGVSLPDHEALVSRASGVALSVVRKASRAIARAAACAGDTARLARPMGTVTAWDQVQVSGATWVRRGEVLTVLASGNHPGIHAAWLEALALGYRLAVRPSVREPFTPHRLVTALRASGFGADQVVFLPAQHHVADDMVEAADLSVVYGGDDVVRAYQRRSDVLVQGPGRSKVLVADGHGEDHVGTVADSVVGLGGTACVNASAAFVEGNVAEFAQALAARLDRIPMCGPLEESTVLPVFPLDRARAIAAHHRAVLGEAELVSDPDLVVPLGDGSAVLRPAVALLDRATAPQVRIEMPFPCVWVAPWTRADGVAPLRDTLTLTAITTDVALLDALADEPSISNLHIGDHPTYLMSTGLPHDGHLAEFLMRSKTVIRDFPPRHGELEHERSADALRPRHPEAGVRVVQRGTDSEAGLPSLDRSATVR